MLESEDLPVSKSLLYSTSDREVLFMYILHLARYIQPLDD